MTELLTTKETLVALENIIKKAEKYICIFTYNIKIDPNYLSRLRNAVKRGVKITIVFGVQSGDPEVIDSVLNIPGVEVYFKEYLHAKFYYNEKELLVGSMNLSEASAKNNYELAVLFTSEDYQRVIKKVKEEAKEIIDDSQRWKVSIPSKSESTYTKVPSKRGLCIRCGNDIKYDPLRPLCPKCYSDWSEWENEYYQEIFCHSCGQKKGDISYAKPECIKCYRKETAFGFN
jgi:phosphatidylserine/phosphatidylglycerophosphate/cardiolipin synthase-like enzyme